VREQIEKHALEVEEPWFKAKGNKPTTTISEKTIKNAHKLKRRK
jgi:hypothetical protein